MMSEQAKTQRESGQQPEVYLVRYFVLYMLSAECCRVVLRHESLVVVQSRPRDCSG